MKTEQTSKNIFTYEFMQQRPYYETLIKSDNLHQASAKKELAKPNVYINFSQP